MKKFLRIFLLFLPTIVILGIIEIALRLSPWNNYLSPKFRYGCLYDYSFFWKPAPLDENPLKIVHNPWEQFRGKKYSKKKPKGVYRIICLGGSSTWGWPIKDASKVYPAILEKLLSEKFKDRRFQVINAGVGGYSTFQQVRYFKYYLIDYEPDLVTICCGANDAAYSKDIQLTISDKKFWQKLQKAVKEGKFNSPLFKLKRFLANFRIFNALETLIFKIKLIFIEPERRVPVFDFKENIRELVNICQSRNIKLVLITESIRNSKTGLAEYNEVLKGFSEEYNIPFVWTHNILYDPKYFYDKVHLNYEGHKILAKLIYDKLIESNILNQ